MEARVNQNSMNRSLKVKKGVLLKAIKTELERTSNGGCKGPLVLYQSNLILDVIVILGEDGKSFLLKNDKAR